MWNEKWMEFKLIWLIRKWKEQEIFGIIWVKNKLREFYKLRILEERMILIEFEKWKLNDNKYWVECKMHQLQKATKAE